MKLFFTICAAMLVSTGFSQANKKYIKLKGAINSNLFITMELEKDSRAFTGNYYYDKIGKLLTVFGTQTKDSFLLAEMDNKGDETGIFRGIINVNNDVKGVWINTKTKKQFSFSLSEVHENIAQFDYTDYSAEKCDDRNKNLLSTKKDTLNYWDTLCATTDISTITVKNLAPNVCKKINNKLLNTMLEMNTADTVCTTIDQMLRATANGEVQYGMGVQCNETNNLCICVSVYGMSFGAAHPGGYFIDLNFSPQTGDTIGLQQLLLPNTMNKLITLTEKYFYQQNDSTGWFFEDDGFKLAKNFIFSQRGLTFEYNAYEAGPYVAGLPTVFIPKKDLVGIVKPEYIR